MESASAKHGPALFDDPIAYCRRYCTFEAGSEPAEHPVMKQRLATFDKFYKRATIENARILELGGGPTIYTLISAVKYAESITFTDLKDRNIDFIKTWRSDSPESFDFASLIGYTVNEVEGNRSDGAVEARKSELRRKMTTIQTADVTDPNPLDASLAGTYDVISVHYCLLHAVKTHDEYSPLIANLGRYLKRGSIFLLSEMLGCFHAQRQFESEKEGSGEQTHHHHHEHGPDHEAKRKQFIFDSVKKAGFEVVEHELIARDKPLYDVPGANDAGSWTTVMIMARKQ